MRSGAGSKPGMSEPIQATADLPDIPVRAYAPRRRSRSLFVELRGLRHHVRLWGEPDRNPMVMIHGAADASATFQFLVDALPDEWSVIAPDLRGYGLSGWAAGGYAFPDYLADLDGILTHLFGERPLPLVGHSLGGNVACLYAGIRPERVSHLVSLDGFGLPDRNPSEAPEHLRRWLDSWANPPSGSRVYADLTEMAGRLRMANPRLDEARALFLAEHLGRVVPGGLTWAFEPAHRRAFAAMFRAAEWEACIARIAAPVLWIGSGSTFPPALDKEPGTLERRVGLARAAFRRVPQTGHNLHHDAPEAVAGLIEDFLAGRLSDPDEVAVDQ
jgi:pimeloyl-ACP methyl ester carboxylesterase